MSTERGCHRLQEGYTCEVSRVAAGERRAEMPVESNAVRMERAQSTKVCGIIGKGGARSSRTGACAPKVRQAAHLRGQLPISPL